jgi:hypothetical protein
MRIPTQDTPGGTFEAQRDRTAYALAKEYLLSFSSVGITEELLGPYLTPVLSTLRPETVEDIYRRILLSAQSRGVSVGVIGAALIDRLAIVLCGFQPAQIVAKYGPRWAEVLDDIERQLHPRGKIRRGPRGIWPLFCRTITSGAVFMAQFTTADEFYGWVDVFDRDDRSRAALPALLALEIDGFGFPLACDFLKDLGCFNFAKADVQLKTIFKGLGLVKERASDYEVFKAIGRVAKHQEVTPYNVDKLFWLVGSGHFHDHPQLGSGGRIGTDKAKFIAEAKAKLGSDSSAIL